jgi:hypothetical protein
MSIHGPTSLLASAGSASQQCSCSGPARRRKVAFCVHLPLKKVLYAGIGRGQRYPACAAFQCDHGPDGAAVRLGLPRTTLMYKMRRLGISRGRDYFEFAEVARNSD